MLKRIQKFYQPFVVYRMDQKFQKTDYLLPRIVSVLWGLIGIAPLIHYQHYMIAFFCFLFLVGGTYTVHYAVLNVASTVTEKGKYIYPNQAQSTYGISFMLQMVMVMFSIFASVLLCIAK